ncbi:NAD-dependent epimerase/dehydratase family protein [Candidatus Methylopumilus universalis]|uniref:UDP-glucose 4-epimerase n=1 Tax=Candidatus Methylopumilus universalis TaxID=2588536 RepID=A0AAX1EZN0_9PROT|nr:polysaccharide biosynthesis protein [Candidatus Methylopumilus universalis]QDC41237.1 NAD-dependent epimerase/dehydratase family protein [Candidatus Methylopumilus universalis]QDC42527.1 NAD-dependent epimerase/dehydratase family protein [Candidatus Methylopumilus universalis]QDC54913.1 NAD-dependent epimerase/dehydratase family protein [Candidatus Methylopumilus universalis]QDC56194.1 NAD-dependent epimerase/dehydratase family protein [Candidatus Methylopumilus universalis]QDC57476.1 NAD-d
MLKDKTILITGGTGSFGSEVLLRALENSNCEIRILSRDEKKQEDIRNLHKNNRLSFFIGDVKDPNSLLDAFNNVDIVFHAAALKQVPTCEFFPSEAFKTNVIGTENVIKAACLQNVKKVIFLSTDKAVYPINAMGLSKSMAEKIIQATARLSSKTKFTITRYGNVIYSRGSVVPLFVNQILNKKPITITQPNMTRFMMTLNEAVDLVFEAFESGENGDIYIKKSPSVKICDLALALKELFNSSVEIKSIGTRHGEKLHETLISNEELLRAKESNEYYIIKPDLRDINYNEFYTIGREMNYQDYSSNTTKILTANEIKELLITIPEIKKIIKGF